MTVLFSPLWIRPVKYAPHSAFDLAFDSAVDSAFDLACVPL